MSRNQSTIDALVTLAGAAGITSGAGLRKLRATLSELARAEAEKAGKRKRRKRNEIRVKRA